MRKTTTKEHDHQLRKINSDFLKIFENINIGDQNDRNIAGKLKWIRQEFNANWNLINHVHVATLLNKLPELQLMNQLILKGLVDDILRKSVELLSQKKTSSNFKVKEICQMFVALPKLPITWLEQKKFLVLLISQTTISVTNEIEILSQLDSVILLCGLAKLRFNLVKYATLVTTLLKKIDIAKVSNSEFEMTSDFDIRKEPYWLGPLWQFCAYTKTLSIENQKINYMIDYCEKELMLLKEENQETDVTKSIFQEKVYKLLINLLKKEFIQDTKQEYLIGCYRLDIAIPSLKLNIEVDGPFHYIEQRLKPNDKFRDKILTEYCKWRVVRIPFFDWEKLTSNRERSKYLLTILKERENIFNAAAIRLLQEPPKQVELESQGVRLRH